MPELADDPKYCDRENRQDNRLSLIQDLSKYTQKFTKSDLLHRLGGKIPFGPVMNIQDVLNDQHFAAREMLVEVENPGTSPVMIAGVPIKMTESPGKVARRAPLLGEHTREILMEAGVSEYLTESVLNSR